MASNQLYVHVCMVVNVCRCENTSQDPANHRSKHEISYIVFGFVLNMYARCSYTQMSKTAGIKNILDAHWMEISMFNSFFLRESMLEKRVWIVAYVYFDTTCIGMETLLVVHASIFKWNLYSLWDEITKRANRNRDLFADLQLQIRHCRAWMIQMDFTTNNHHLEWYARVSVCAKTHMVAHEIWILYIQFDWCNSYCF